MLLVVATRTENEGSESFGELQEGGQPTFSLSEMLAFRV